MNDRIITRAEMETAEADQQDHKRNRAVFAVGSVAERISALVNLLVSVFRADWYVDFQQHYFERDSNNPSKIFKIVVKHTHSVYIKNVGTGRIRIFNDLWLAAGEFFEDSNQHYRKYYRDIDLLLSDNYNDAEGYLNVGQPSLLTHKCIVITKQVTSH